MNWVRPWLPIETGRLDVLYDFLKVGKPYEIISLPPEGRQALTEFVNKLHQASLVRYNPNIPIQGWILLGKKTMLAAIVQQSQPLEWVHTTLENTPRVYSLVDQRADIIIKIRDMSL